MDFYERDVDDTLKSDGPWVGTHDGSSISPSDSYSRWKFYDSNDISACSNFEKECDDEDSAYFLFATNIISNDTVFVPDRLI